MKQVFNPYLPLYEYIPDGEPHVFNGRIYVYGSHDQFGAFQFCHNDYVAWSAPVDDLSDWRYEGVILKKDEDPDNKNGKRDLFAPDVTCGPDGKYYIYYAYDFLGKIGVAKSDTPIGPFKFHGHVRYQDGIEIGTKKEDIFHFDPGVLTDEDGRVYLYSGFAPKRKFPQIRSGLKVSGCYCMELDKDMLSVIKGPVKVLSKVGETDKTFKGHEFFEASSIRKLNGIYYLVYSSIEGHELCYATSSSPFGPFKFGGVIVSNGDVGLNGRAKKDAIYPLGNNHGGIVKVGDYYYIFYHRHTNYTNTDRQGMAEKIRINSDGSINQVEITSCGLNDGPLKGEGEYPSTICCCLKPKEGNVFYPFFKTPLQKITKTYITQAGKDSDTKETQYISNVKNGCLIGYKYFDLSKTHEVIIRLSGKGDGKIGIRYVENGDCESYQKVSLENKGIRDIAFNITRTGNKDALYFYFEIKGKLNILSIILK